MMTMSARRRARGLSLIELMITIAIAAFLVIGLVQVFMAARASFLTQEQVGRLQENGRYAYEFISTELRQAGYRRATWDPPRLGFALDGATSNGNQLTLLYETDRDCNGVRNATTENVDTPNGTVAVPAHWNKIVRIAVTAGGQLTYACGYSTDRPPALGAPEVVANDIETLQVQYGRDLTGDLSINDWDTVVDANVVAVRFSLVVTTPEALGGVIEGSTQTLSLYGGNQTAGNDGLIRRVYAGQVNMRNLTL